MTTDEATRPTVAVVTDLWPSAGQPHAGTFVRGQVAALQSDFRQIVLVPRLLFRTAHERVWGNEVQGAESNWAGLEPPGRVLSYPIVRVPKRGEAAARTYGVRLRLAKEQERPALVHGHFLHEVGVAATRVGRKLDVPVVVTVHGTDGRWLVQGGVQERHRAAMREAVRRADRVIVVERQLAEQVAAAAGVGADKISVVPMAVDETLFRPRSRGEARSELGLAQDERFVLFVGSATRLKGIDVLDRAMRDVAARAIAVGPAGAGERIRFVGMQEPLTVARWLAAADVFCLPSLAEGMPVSVMEALASGRPVVASSVGGIPEQVDDGHTGFVVPPGDPSALAEALRRALHRQWDEQAIRAASQPFWWSTVAPQVSALYRALL